MNLGTLSNFLDQDDEKRFKRLASYVREAGILEGKKDNDVDTLYFIV